MRFYKVLPHSFALLSAFVMLFLQGCGFLQSDLSKLKPNPSLPQIIQARTIVDVSSVGFEWSGIKNLENIEGYTIAIKNDKQKLVPLTTILNPYATHAVVSGLAPQTPYTFYLIVLGKNKTIATRQKVIAITTSYIDPIEHIFTTGGLPREMKIFWTPHSNPSVRKYLIQRQDDKGVFRTIGEIPHRLLVEYFDKGLEDGKKYSYRIIAVSFEGKESLPSVPISGETRQKPAPLTNVKASNNQAKSIKLTWNEPKNTDFPINLFEIYASDTPDDKFKKIGTSRKTSFEEIGLLPEQIRFYKVIPVDQDGIEGDLNIPVVSGKTLPLPPTPKITLSAVRKNAAVLKWEADPSKVESFKVCRTERGKKKTRICFENIQKNFFIDREMQENISYHYEVYSLDAFKQESLPTPEIKLER